MRSLEPERVGMVGVRFSLSVGDLVGGLVFFLKFAPSIRARKGLASWLLWSAWLLAVLSLRSQIRRCRRIHVLRQWCQNHRLQPILQILQRQV